MLRVERLTKRYGDLIAVNDVSFESSGSEVVALLGENGAGKTTLLSCIAGFAIPEQGRVLVGGDQLAGGQPGSAITHGVGTAFQHFSLVPSFTVEESFALARLPAGLVSSHLPERISGRTRIDELGIADRQRVEFLKAKLAGTRVLLLDEPTSPLGEIDVERVLEEIRDASKSGATVLFVTHRLREALSVADRILVMRRGFLVGSWVRPGSGWPDEMEHELIAAMFGTHEQAMPLIDRSEPAPEPAGVIVVTEQQNQRRVTIGRGRVLAVLGVAGNGQRSLTRLLFGETEARVELVGDGNQVHDGQWLKRHATVIPEDRIGEGIAPDMRVGETLVLRDLVQGRLQRRGWVSRRAIKHRAMEMIAAWRVSPDDPNTRVGNLSGGNIQRVILARALDPLPELLVAVNPTQGLDLQTAQSVRRRLRQAAESGTAVVVLEQDVDDALHHADAVSVLYKGQLSPLVGVAAADRQRLQLMMVAGW